MVIARNRIFDILVVLKTENRKNVNNFVWQYIMQTGSFYLATKYWIEVKTWDMNKR